MTRLHPYIVQFVALGIAVAILISAFEIAPYLAAASLLIARR